jgi:DNA polymerase I-like protein with 3'-5' exonuclease and polymerase domains
LGGRVRYFSRDASSLRFSYSNPPLQLMPSRDEELSQLIRGVFLPEEDEVWAKPDLSQQEFRFIVHCAALWKLSKAAEMVERYRTDPKTDIHKVVKKKLVTPMRRHYHWRYTYERHRQFQQYRANRAHWLYGAGVFAHVP